MRIAVIPARGGSKRIPRKNIKDFCGKPMIVWALEVAKASSLFDHIIVSTDDAEIAKVAESWGAKVPFVRPAELANDHAGTTDVIAHATRWVLDQGWPVNAVCCIYATAPFVQAQDLKQGLEALETGNWAYAFSVTGYASPILRAFRERPEGGLEMFFPDQFEKRSQDLPVALHDAGQFYWGRPDSWLSLKRLFERHSTPVLIPKWRVQDIDSEDDWKRAELLYQILKGQEDR